MFNELLKAERAEGTVKGGQKESLVMENTSTAITVRHLLHFLLFTLFFQLLTCLLIQFDLHVNTGRQIEFH